MNRVLLVSLSTCLFSQAALGQSTFNETNCNGDANYSTCRVPDGTEIKCYGSYCTVTHPNGASGESGGLVLLLVGALVRLHQEHAAQKAAKSAEMALQMLLKGAVLSSDLAGFWEANAHFAERVISPKDKEAAEEVQRGLRQMSGDMYNTASSLVRDLDTKRYRANPKLSQKISDLSLSQVCLVQEGSKQMTAGFLPIAADPRLPAQWTLLFEAVKADEASLEADCTSPEAVKARHRASEVSHEPPMRPPP